MTVLKVAAMSGHMDIVQYCVNKGASITSKNEVRGRRGEARQALTICAHLMGASKRCRII